MSEAQLAPKDLKKYLLAGNAIVTLVSIKTGNRYTYRIRRSINGVVFFVDLLTGPNNQRDYDYFGFIRTHNQAYWYGEEKAKVSEIARSVQGFEKFWGWVQHGMLEKVDRFFEVYHAGFCLRCGRLLSTPTSVTRGIGPECYRQMMGG